MRVGSRLKGCLDWLWSLEMTKGKRTSAEARETPTLAQIQDAFQAAVLGNGDLFLKHIRSGARADRHTLLGVYQHAYLARLLGILKSEYPHLSNYMGEELFGAMIRRYLTAHPSRHRSARWVGDRLPEFLAIDRVGVAHPVLQELSEFERALGNAFDAAEAPELTFAEMATVPLELWSEIVFSPHPSACRLDQTHNTFAIWQALKDGTAPPPVQRQSEVIPLLIWRRHGMPIARRISPEEAMLWDEAVRGAPFGRLCELSAVFDEPDLAAARVANVVRGWLDGCCLSHAGLPAMASSTN